MEIFILIAVLVLGFIFLKPKSKPENTALLPQEFIVFDLETTGLDAGKHEIIEIAAIKINKDEKNHAVFESLVIPQNKIPARITKINNITQKMVTEDGRELESVLSEFRDFVGDLRLVTFNSKFDMAFLDNATNSFGYKMNNPVSCALKMARRAFPGLQSYKLTELAKLGGISSVGAHRALKDAELTVTVYSTAVDILGEIE